MLVSRLGLPSNIINLAEPAIFAPPAKAHGECPECEQHYPKVQDQLDGKSQYHGSFDNIKAQAELTHLMTKTQQDLDHVKERLQTHGDLIISRWSKWTQHKRADLLSLSSEELFGTWPPAEVDDTEYDDGPLKNRSGYTTKFLFQMQADNKGGESAHTGRWLEINALAKDRMRLLSLFHARTEVKPQRWATFDTVESRFVFLRAIGEIHYNSQAVIMHGEKFGQMTEFDTESAHSWAVIGFPRAFVTFQAQALVASMLHAAVDSIIAGEETRPSGNLEWSAMVTRGLRSAHEDALWSSYHHPEFTEPQCFDAAVPLSKVRNQLNLVLDEVELLQTNPEYMYQHAWDMRTNMCSLNALEDGWADVTKIILGTWSFQIVMWRRILIECEHLQTVLTESGITLKPGSRLPKDVDIALQALTCTVCGYIGEQVGRLFPSLCTMSVMEDSVFKMRGWSSHDYANAQKVERTLDHTKKADRIFWQAFGLWKVAGRLSPYGVRMSIRDLNSELAGVTCNKVVSFTLSALALLDELYMSSIRHQMTSLDPNNLVKEEVEAGVRLRDGLPDNVTIALHYAVGSLITQYTRVCSKSLRKFCEASLPQGRKDFAWLKQMTEARRCLASFWEGGRNDLKVRQKTIKRSETAKGEIVAHMSFDLSAGYLADVAAERQQLEECYRSEKAKKKQQHLHMGAQFVRQSWDTAGLDEDVAVRRKMTKKAKKSGGSPDIMPELQGLTLTSDSSVDQTEYGGETPVLIHVKQDTLSVIRKMFSCQGIRLDKGSVRWTNFVQAMTDCGMTATQGAGSAVNFENRDGRVCIHEPHPEPTIDAIQLRGYGQRLSKWFGWTHETFVLREKGDEKP